MQLFPVPLSNFEMTKFTLLLMKPSEYQKSADNCHVISETENMDVMRRTAYQALILFTPCTDLTKGNDRATPIPTPLVMNWGGGRSL
jgi:hypothetical protein